MQPIFRRCAYCAAVLAAFCCSSAPAQDFIHTVVSGETVVSISQRFLEDPKQYWRVQRHNKLPDGRALQPGFALAIEPELLRREAVNATALSVNGSTSVQQEGRVTPLVVGAGIGQGAVIVTGADGSVALQLADGSLVRIPPRSEVNLRSAVALFGGSGFLNVIRLISGRVETVVKKLSRSSRFEITTPTATVGVRGTDFRVSYDAAGQTARSEVLEGAVAFEGSAAGPAKAQSVMLPAGTGSVANRSGVPQPARALLAAPDLATANAGIQEKPVIRFVLRPVDGAKQYRAQIGLDAQMNQIAAENVFDAPEAKFADLADGDYFLRIRAIDAGGLEGMNRTQAFRLKARPEPPLAQAPAPDGKSRGESASFVWGESTEGNQYRFQLARDANFGDLVQDEPLLKSGLLTSRAIAPGGYFWRVRSVRPDGDAGPWSDVRRFSQLPPSAPPQSTESATALTFSWSGESGQTFVFQVARDREFNSRLTDVTTSETSVHLARPAAGVYFSRLRAIDADGFIGPFTPPQRFEVQNRVQDGSGGSLSTGDGKPVRLN